MGSCLSGSTKTLAEDEKNEEMAKGEEMVEQRESFTGSKSNPVTLLQLDGGYKTKMGRFKLQEDDNVGGGSSVEGDSRSGVVRIRAVVTLKELKHMLDSKESSKYSSVEELVRAMNLRGRGICRSRTSYGRMDNSQGAALESISELH